MCVALIDPRGDHLAAFHCTTHFVEYVTTNAACVNFCVEFDDLCNSFRGADCGLTRLVELLVGRRWHEWA
jgi:hypothetical protein